ncbi:MAG: T9SS type A sorting domain-containing protein [Bacteroidia bacterium]|nr:T9SS type A sorting domain-containing protein [Bacteroidia bacterium]
MITITLDFLKKLSGIKNILACTLLFSVASTTIHAQQHKISLIPTPYLWLKADSINSEQKIWPDLSSHSNNINLSSSPIDWSKINYQPSIKMETVAPFEISYRPKLKGAICMFAVYRIDTSQNGYSIWSVKFDSTNFIEMNSHFLRDLYNKSLYSYGSESSPKINFFTQNWMHLKADVSPNHLLVCGGDSILSFKGEIAEIIFYNRELSAKELTNIFTYLAVKYGITLNEINYKRSDNVILWDVQKDREFSNDIAGIGKDSRLQINQKQSAGNGGESLLKISSGISFGNWNKENTHTINEGDFLIWGDNGRNFLSFPKDTSITDLSNSAYLTDLSERQWLIKRTGNTVDQIKTLIMLSAPTLARDTLIRVNLIISPTTNFNFPADSCLVIPADSTDSIGNLYFHNIYWDTDSSGSDAFTFQAASIQHNAEKMANNTAYTDSLNNYDNNSNKDSNNGNISFIHVFPNPSNGLFITQIQLKEPGDVFLFVLDESGRIAYQKKLCGNQCYIENFQLHEAGTYILNIESKEKKQNIKLVVK